MSDLVAALAIRLRTELGVTVVSRVPAPRPTSFILVRRLGGTFTWPVVDQPTVGLEAWAGSEAAAHDLCASARAAIWTLRGGLLDGIAVYRIQEFAGPAALPDPDSGQPRYVATFAIDHREVLAA